MIPIYQTCSDADACLNLERLKARELGRPPFPVTYVSDNISLHEFVGLIASERIAVIFDPEFWYPGSCWERWLRAENSEPSSLGISVPLGNQVVDWNWGLDIPVYLTLRGLEQTTGFSAAYHWAYKRASNSHSFCVAVIACFVLKELPSEMLLKDLPCHWAQQNIKLRVFCQGWLHNFNALGDAGCRYDLLAMTDWQGLVLEVGCGAGLMGKACKEQDQDVTWVGMDLEQQAVQKAKHRLDLVLQADAAQVLPFARDVLFDRIVCADFLEHLAYPWTFLTKIRAMIAPGGRLVASFPNIGHWSIIEDLLAGRFDEAPAGTMCVTHLRFGTKKSWLRWLDQAGWKVVRWEEERIPFPESWQNFSQNIGLDFDQDSLQTFRYRILAEPK